MAQHFLLSAASTTMSIFDAVRRHGDRGFVVWYFAIPSEGRTRREIASSADMPINEVRRLCRQLREIMLEQTDDQQIDPLVKSRHTRMMRTIYREEIGLQPKLMWAEAAWRHKFRRTPTGERFYLLWDALQFRVAEEERDGTA